MLLGYVIGLITIPRFISQERYLAYSAVLGVLLAVGAFFTHGFASVVFVAALGFANAMMWPAIFPLAIQGLGRFTEYGSALLIMGIAGGAVIPQLFVQPQADTRLPAGVPAADGAVLPVHPVLRAARPQRRPCTAHGVGCGRDTEHCFAELTVPHAPARVPKHGGGG